MISNVPSLPLRVSYFSSFGWNASSDRNSCGAPITTSASTRWKWMVFCAATPPDARTRRPRKPASAFMKTGSSASLPFRPRPTASTTVRLLGASAASRRGQTGLAALDVADDVILRSGRPASVPPQAAGTRRGQRGRGPRERAGGSSYEGSSVGDVPGCGRPGSRSAGETTPSWASLAPASARPASAHWARGRRLRRLLRDDDHLFELELPTAAADGFGTKSRTR